MGATSTVEQVGVTVTDVTGRSGQGAEALGGDEGKEDAAVAAVANSWVSFGEEGSFDDDADDFG